MPESILSLRDIDKIANLARLALRPDERETYQRQLSSILDYVNTLQSLDTKDIEATFMVLPRHNVLRTDETASCLSHAAALQNAPAVEGPYFKMPRILEEE